MFSTIYVERDAASHPRTREVLGRYPAAAIIPCNRYGEIFNRKAQRFRLQKRRPALIIARKSGRLLLDTPGGFGIGGARSFYFSHLYNCLYDCRYCFLQGMYRSAHYVLFINYEDFAAAIERAAAADTTGKLHFFSGYDCDSLALEPVTGFAAAFLPLFRRLPGALLELRTKSTQVRTLLAQEPVSNCVVAFSFTPADASRKLERKVPSIRRRVDAMKRLQDAGWMLGLRFDPLIYTPDYRDQYRSLFDLVLGTLDAARLHSVSLGGFRVPRDFFQPMQRQHPREPLFASVLEDGGGFVGYPESLRAELGYFCRSTLLQHLPAEKLYTCEAF